MGKKIPSQRRGKGSPVYRVPSFRFTAPTRLFPASKKGGKVVDIIHDPGHSTPLALVKFEDSSTYVLPAAEGVYVNQEMNLAPRPGNVLRLADVPEGSTVFNIELSPDDGGKLVRSAGAYARLISKEGSRATLRLPSGQFKSISLACRAIVGIAAGGGRREKPYAKGGKKYHAMRAKNRLWPRVKGNVKNPVDHPFGGGKKGKTGKSITVGRNAPPGRKVGYIAARRTGRRK